MALVQATLRRATTALGAVLDCQAQLWTLEDWSVWSILLGVVAGSPALHVLKELGDR
jgi:hypothetical protein